MQQYILRRLLLFIPTLLLASLATFLILRALPGDVALVILGGEANTPTSVEQLEAYRVTLGLRDPLPVQYGRWMVSLVDGEFGGKSLADGEPIGSIIARRLPVTLQLAFYALVISMIVSIPLGIAAAVHQNKWQDYAVRVVTLSGHALPNFWLALVLLLVLSVVFTWSPPVFYKNLWEDPVLHLEKAVWPALILAWGFSANITRITRSNMLEVLNQDYVRTARAKGLVERLIVSRHALQNALIPVLTLAGLQLAGLLGGTVVLESIFGMPGIGQGIVLATNSRDYPVIQTLAMLLVLMMLALNLVVDLCYAAIDPRISYR
jgi:peptide/nickel transport system permease protein